MPEAAPTEAAPMPEAAPTEAAPMPEATPAEGAMAENIIASSNFEMMSAGAGTTSAL
jgi:hypothetical protein